MMMARLRMGHVILFRCLWAALLPGAASPAIYESWIDVPEPETACVFSHPHIDGVTPIAAELHNAELWDMPQVAAHVVHVMGLHNFAPIAGCEEDDVNATCARLHVFARIAGRRAQCAVAPLAAAAGREDPDEAAALEAVAAGVTGDDARRARVARDALLVLTYSPGAAGEAARAAFDRYYARSFDPNDASACAAFAALDRAEDELAAWSFGVGEGGAAGAARDWPDAALFVHVPKTGGSIVRVLAHVSGATPNATRPAHFTPAHFAAVAPRAWAAALGAERGAAARPWLIVRDPWSRALSAFRYLARGRARRLERHPSGAAGRWWVEGVHPLDVSMGRRLRAAFGDDGFANFASLAAPGAPGAGLAHAARHWVHFLPQARWAAVGVRVVKFEELFYDDSDGGGGGDDAAGERMFERLRTAAQLPPLPAGTRPARPPLARRDAHCDAYTREAAAAVATVYAEDIALFGYGCSCSVCAAPG